MPSKRQTTAELDTLDDTALDAVSGGASEEIYFDGAYIISLSSSNAHAANRSSSGHLKAPIDREGDG